MEGGVNLPLILSSCLADFSTSVFILNVGISLDLVLDLCLFSMLSTQATQTLII